MEYVVCAGLFVALKLAIIFRKIKKPRFHPPRAALQGGAMTGKPGLSRNGAAAIAALFVFALAFGYVEGAVAHYLRMHYYPGGFAFPLKEMDLPTVLIEMGREFATLVMMASVAFFFGGPFYRRFAAFVFVFGVWDIAYYGGLWLFESWPRSLLDPDVLFLIPVPWMAPVIVPIVVSGLGIAGFFLEEWYFRRSGKVRIGFPAVLCQAAAFVVWLVSFLLSFAAYPAQGRYSWPLFFTGCGLTLAAFALLARDNTVPKGLLPDTGMGSG